MGLHHLLVRKIGRMVIVIQLDFTCLRGVMSPIYLRHLLPECAESFIIKRDPGHRPTLYNAATNKILVSRYAVSGSTIRLWKPSEGTMRLVDPPAMWSDIYSGRIRQIHMWVV